MSSGIVKNNYPTINLPIQTLFDLDKDYGQKYKNQFITELVLMLFSQKKCRNSFKQISNFIRLCFKIPDVHFTDIIFSGINGIFFQESKNNEASYSLNINYGDHKNIYLLMLNRIRSIFNNYPDLTNNDKFNYCGIER